MPRITGVCHGKSTRSRPHMTALTPGRAWAFAKLIALMRACGWGLRRTLPNSMPGCAKSAPKAARPVTFSTPSGLMVRLPIHLLSVEPFAVMPAVSILAVLPLATDTAAAEQRLPMPESKFTHGAGCVRANAYPIRKPAAGNCRTRRSGMRQSGSWGLPAGAIAGPPLPRPSQRPFRTPSARQAPPRGSPAPDCSPGPSAPGGPRSRRTWRRGVQKQ